MRSRGPSPRRGKADLSRFDLLCPFGARPPEGAKQIEPGEVYIYGPGGNSLYLRRDGSVEIRGGKVSIDGQLTVNGRLWEPSRQ